MTENEVLVREMMRSDLQLEYDRKFKQWREEMRRGEESQELEPKPQMIPITRRFSISWAGLLILGMCATVGYLFWSEYLK